MKIYTKLVIDIETRRTLCEEFFDYRGDLQYAKGATAAQNSLQTSQANFYNTLSSDYASTFANQQSILSSLQSAWQPILQAGPNQYGYSTAQDTALRSQATEQTAQQYANAEKSLGSQLATEGGGNSFMPSGANAQLEQQTNLAAAQQESAANLGITQAGYAQGLANFNAASSALGGVSSQYNPTGYAGAANTGGEAAGTTANQIQQANAAASPLGTIGGILSGVAGVATGGGSSIGGDIFNTLAAPSGPSGPSQSSINQDFGGS